jgi:hypothetical protein
VKKWAILGPLPRQTPPGISEQETASVQVITWNDLEPILRRTMWDQRSAHDVFWGGSEVTQRLHELVRRACNRTVARSSLRNRGYEEDIYHDCLIILWRRCEEYCGLAPPSHEINDAAHWIVKIASNAAFDATCRLINGDTMTSRSDRARILEIARAEEYLMQRDGCAPSAEAVANVLGITIEVYHSWKARAATTVVHPGAPTGPEEGSKIRDICEDRPLDDRVDARSYLEALKERIQNDDGIMPFRRLSFACYELPDALTYALVKEAAARSRNNTGLLRNAEETWSLLQVWRSADRWLDDIASRRTLACIFRSRCPLLQHPEPGEDLGRLLVHECKIWARTEPQAAEMARTTVRMWAHHARNDLGINGQIQP